MKRRAAQFTTEPSTPPPDIDCPRCAVPLLYEQTVYNGVAPLERWDFFRCRGCGPFEYRHRTRTVRQSQIDSLLRRSRRQA